MGMSPSSLVDSRVEQFFIARVQAWLLVRLLSDPAITEFLTLSQKCTLREREYHRDQTGNRNIDCVGRLKLTTLVDIDELKIVGSVSLILGVATDVFTSAALCFFLRGLRTGYSK